MTRVHRHCLQFQGCNVGSDVGYVTFQFVQIACDIAVGIVRNVAPYRKSIGGEFSECEGRIPLEVIRSPSNRDGSRLTARAVPHVALSSVGIRGTHGSLLK
jgi:hypothetical protein